MAIEFRNLKPEEVEVRVGQCSENGVSLLLYKDSRCDMRLLDECVGPENWDCHYESIDGKMFCKVGIATDAHGWVYKQDVGTPSNMEADKGEASDAFKRACFKWGIGRELYTAPHVFVRPEKCNIKKGRNGKPQCYDKFSVTEMVVESGEIASLTICNMSKKGEVVFGGKAKRAPAKKEQGNDLLRTAYEKMGKAIEGWCERHGIVDEDEVKAKKDGIRKRPEWATQKMSVDYIESIVREFDDD